MVCNALLVELRALLIGPRVHRHCGNYPVQISNGSV